MEAALIFGNSSQIHPYRAGILRTVRRGEKKNVLNAGACGTVAGTPAGSREIWALAPDFHFPHLGFGVLAGLDLVISTKVLIP